MNKDSVKVAFTQGHEYGRGNREGVHRRGELKDGGLCGSGAECCRAVPLTQPVTLGSTLSLSSSLLPLPEIRTWIADLLAS